MTKIDMGLFELGETAATPGAMELLGVYGVNARELLFKHQTGDWGVWDWEYYDIDINQRVMRENNHAVEHGGRIVSCFPVRSEFDPDAPEEFVVAVTEADRSRTTVMTLDEYLAVAA